MYIYIYIYIRKNGLALVTKIVHSKCCVGEKDVVRTLSSSQEIEYSCAHLKWQKFMTKKNVLGTCNRKST